ncbi:MAG: hypothetical protein IE927_12720 [Rhodobacterales bacterium]|nr:hypothetical protein [Rhodobacterales bacterium]
MATYNGSGGSNSYTGTADGDSIAGNGGDDALNGAAGADTISGGSGADSLLGGDGNDRIDGGSGNDRLFGGVNDDTLAGGTGNDSLTGDAGTDTASYAAATGAVTVNLTSGSATGADGTDTLSGIENVTGSAYSDALTGDGGANALDGGAGNDTIGGAAGDDSLTGGAGQDSLSGGDGNDTLVGSAESGTTTVSLDLNWLAAGKDEQDVDGGITQDTGGITFDVSFTDDGRSTEISLEDDIDAYVAPDETFARDSTCYLAGSGAGDTSTTVLDFSDTPGSGLEDEVQNVTFRINDIDASGTSWQDIVTITAYDADGNPVPVTLTPLGGDTVSGDTISAQFLAEDPDDAGGSVLVSIPGPVAGVEIDYGNTGSSAQVIYISDVKFQAVVSEDDVLDGGAGDDLLIGGTGDDLLSGGTGADTLTGGEGADTLTGGDDQDVIFAGIGDTVGGGKGGADADTLDLSGAAPFRTTYVPGNPEAGTVTFFSVPGKTNPVGTLTFRNI